MEIPLNVLGKRMNRCISELIKYKKFLDSIPINRSYTVLHRYLKSIESELNEASGLVFEYNSLEKKEKVHPCAIVTFQNENIEKVSICVKNILREIETARDCLEEKIKPNLSEKEKTKLNSLRKELEELEGKNCNYHILKNLKESLNESEESHHLASAIISARIIDYIIQTIKGEENLGVENINDKIIEKLRELGILKKDIEAGSDKKFFIDAAKSSRDAISHKIEFFPSASESISILTQAFRMSEIFCNWENCKK